MISSLLIIFCICISSVLSSLAVFDDLLSAPSYVFGPLDVPCNQSLCEGPLAEIYCHGEILSNSWRFGLEKTCPGDKLKIPAGEVLKKFKKLRKLAAELHERWKRLARQFTSDVFHHSDLYPLLPVPNPFIVPGGRFDVYFYWDTFWIIKGLLISKMHDTTKGIIENFSSLVATLGYIPNSGNLQLTRRSQPPLFPHMVWEYTKSTGIYDRKWFESMETEMKFWETNRSISFDNRQLFVYRTLSNCPRPENFLGDYNMGMRTPNPSSVWRAISSACESGWDFSSRWMDQNSTADLSSIHTDRIIPVDLNTIIANNYRYMASYSDHFGLFDKSARYREKFEKLKEAIQSVLWDEGAGAWFDYDLTTQKKNLNFYPSNVYPLLIPGFETHADRVADYMKVSGALNYTGGIPSSLLAHSTQQWDYPNVWAPNQHFLVQSFLSSNNSFLRDIARRQMESFIDTVHNGLYNPMKGFDEGIWEKYDGRSRIGAPGRGGEYVAQEGFGWTNGAVLDFIWILNQYQERSDRSQPVQLNNTQQSSLIYAVVGFCVLLAIIMVFKGIIRPKSMQQLDEAGALLLGDEDDQDEL